MKEERYIANTVPWLLLAAFDKVFQERKSEKIGWLISKSKENKESFLCLIVQLVFISNRKKKRLKQKWILNDQSQFKKKLHGKGKLKHVRANFLKFQLGKQQAENSLRVWSQMKTWCLKCAHLKKDLLMYTFIQETKWNPIDKNLYSLLRQL